jgi:hypothetical protein
MQVARDKGFEKRAQLYAAKAYSRQSCSYFDLQKVYFIAISNCNLFPMDVHSLSAMFVGTVILNAVVINVLSKVIEHFSFKDNEQPGGSLGGGVNIEGSQNWACMS